MDANDITPERAVINLGKMDWEILRNQKQELLKIIWDDKENPLWGIVHLIDKIQDEAAKVHGDAVVFGTTPDTEDK